MGVYSCACGNLMRESDIPGRRGDGRELEDDGVSR